MKRRKCPHCRERIKGEVCLDCKQKRTCWRCGKGIRDYTRVCDRCLESFLPKCRECGETLAYGERKDGVCWRCQIPDYWVQQHMAGG